MSTPGGRVHVGATPPRWATWAAYGAVASVLPSALWRVAVGLGADLGTTEAWREAQDLPGWGTGYVLALSLLSVGAAALTLGLVQPWGEVVPGWVPVLRGRVVPVWLPVTLAVIGASCVFVIAVLSAVNWEQVVGYEGRPSAAGYALVTAAYVPALLWAPLLLVSAGAYWHRRVRGPRRSASAAVDKT